MFNIKKFTAILLSIAILASLAGCTAKPSTDSGEGEGVTPTPPVAVEEREYNYLTGKELSPDADKTARPFAVMVTNSKAAMPQSGIEAADIIYEMVTEAGITRLMALYSDINDISVVGPVRSARDQFVQFLLPLNAIYAHIGTSIYAKDMLNFYNYQDIDGLYLGTTSFDFDSERNKLVGSEHCWYTKSNLIADGIAAAGISTTGNLFPAFKFADYKNEPLELQNGKTAMQINVKFSDYSDTVMVYNETEKRYYKSTFGQPQIDALTGNQISFDNFILLATDISLYPDGLCTSFDLTEGKGYYFYGGKYIPITWKKGSPPEPLQLFVADGELLEVNVGKSYVAVLGNDMLEHLVISETVQAPPIEEPPVEEAPVEEPPVEEAPAE